jgi:hypothetical protein
MVGGWIEIWPEWMDGADASGGKFGANGDAFPLINGVDRRSSVCLAVDSPETDASDKAQPRVAGGKNRLLAGWVDVTPQSRGRTRREVLRAGALAALAIPLVAACGPGYGEGPDVLTELAQQARADADAATELASSSPGNADLAQQIATLRTAHATAIQAEVDRQNSPPTTVRLPGFPSGLAGMKQRLAHAREQAEKLVPGLPAYRAGLIGSVAAGCAGAQRLSDQLGPGEAPGDIKPDTTVALTKEAIEPMQQALASEHVAVWIYGLVSAFLPSDYTNGINEGAAEHRDRRDMCARLLAAAGANPVSPEPAYISPKPVTNAQSATSVVGIAEADSEIAWRSVLEHTEDQQLRTMARRALVSSARRGTKWRDAAGEKPAAIALPGAPV